MKRIEFGELRIGNTARKNLIDCCDKNWASAGEKVKAFETNWGQLFNYKHNYAMSSGTDACINMCLAVRAAREWNPMQGIVVPALSFIATSNAVRAAGYHPIWVDINRETLNIDTLQIAEALEKAENKGIEPVAIMPVHTMGRPCDMDTIWDIAKQEELYVLEDCCEAHGAKYHGEFVGTQSHAAAFSFYIAHLVCAGEGGMVSSNDDNLAVHLKSTRSHGRKDGALYFDHPNYGLNSKMNDLEASLGLEGVENFWDTFNTRHATMKAISQGLYASNDYIYSSNEEPENTNCPHGISLTVKEERFDIRGLGHQLDKANIHWKRNFGCIPTQHKAFREYGHSLGEFPESEYVGTNGIHIGCHQYLTTQEVDRIILTVNSYFKGM